MNQLILATEQGIVICERKMDAWHESSHGLRDQHATSVIARESVILAGTENGIFRSDDEGAAFGMLARAYEKVGAREKAREAYLRGIEAAKLHGHPSMAEDYRMTLQTDYEN